MQNDYLQEVTRLRDRVSALQAENQNLRNMLRVEACGFTGVAGLGKSKAMLVGALVNRGGRLAKSALYDVLYGARLDTPPGDKTIDTLLCPARRRLNPHRIHGAARGADTIAGEWAHARGVPVQAFPADWNKYGRAAGPIRNGLMLADGSPTFVFAFPGGRGTANMASLAERAGVPVLPIEART